MWTLEMMRRTVYQTAITTGLDGGGPPQGRMVEVDVFPGDWGGPGVGGHPPDSQSLHHPTQNLFPFMEAVFH